MFSNNNTPSPFQAEDTAQPTNSAIRRPVTVGIDITQPSVIASRDISYVIDCLKNGRFESQDLRAKITLIRNLTKSPLYATLKRQLPWFTPSRCARKRSNASVKEAWFMIFDLDNVPDIEAVKRKIVSGLPCVKACFQSPGNGVKALLAFAQPLTRQEDYRLIWHHLAPQIENIAEHPVDSAPDWARACFFSWDPKLLKSPDFTPLDPAQALREAELANLEILRAKEAKSLSANNIAKAPDSFRDDFEKARHAVQNLANQKIAYMDWIRIGMALSAAFGAQGKDLWDIFLNNPFYEDSQRDLDRKWKSFNDIREISLGTLFEIAKRYGCSQ